MFWVFCMSQENGLKNIFLSKWYIGLVEVVLSKTLYLAILAVQ